MNMSVGECRSAAEAANSVGEPKANRSMKAVLK